MRSWWRKRSRRGATWSGSHMPRAASASLRDKRVMVVAHATMPAIIVPLTEHRQDVSNPSQQPEISEDHQGRFVSGVALTPGVIRCPIPGACSTVERRPCAVMRPTGPWYIMYHPAWNATSSPVVMHHASPDPEDDFQSHGTSCTTRPRRRARQHIMCLVPHPRGERARAVPVGFHPERGHQ